MDFGFVTCVNFALYFGLCSLTYGDVFTATSDLETLFETQSVLIHDLEKYIFEENRKINIIKTFLKQFKEEYTKAHDDIPNYLGNPINAFSVIKKLTNDLDFIQNVTHDGFRHSSVKYPTQEDLQGAARAISRLQNTYHLNVTQLAKGILKGNFSHGHQTVTEHFKPMTTSDCYVLGQQLYIEKEYKKASDWFLEAFHKYDNEEHEICSFTKVDILEHISKAYHSLDDVRNALIWTKKLLALDSEDEPSKVRKILVEEYQKRIAEEELQNHGNEKVHSQPGTAPSGEDPNHAVIRMAYEALCRGETDIRNKALKRLECRYLTENDPFLKLAPIKTEQLHSEPDVFLFYDVISDDEIQDVKNLAKPRLNRAKVKNPKTGIDETAQYRISKSVFLKDEESDVLALLTRRISHFTGLNMDTAEQLQVANYGIGGHYAPHHDYFSKLSSTSLNIGPTSKRIATVLFYMSDVTQGGATVFLNLGLSVFPVKRAALFWLNLHPSGEGDQATLHAACPVLRGSKWASNKWIHNVGQEFIRPCNLEYQDEDYERKNLNRTYLRY